MDFVVRRGKFVTAIEVRSAARREKLPGMARFAAEFRVDRKLLVGEGGIAVEQFLAKPAAHWTSA